MTDTFRHTAARRLSTGVAAAVALALCFATTASAQFGIPPGGFDVQTLDAGGAPETRAGVAPDRVVTRLTLNTAPHPDFPPEFGLNVPVDDIKEAQITLPVGLAGEPASVPRCEAHDFAFGSQCPAAARVGTARVVGFGNSEPYVDPIYNIHPGRHVARFAFRAASVAPTYITVDVVKADGDYRLRATVSSITTLLMIHDTTIELWGVPADHNGGGGPRTPLVRNPVSCDRSMSSSARVASWQDPATWVLADGATSTEVTDCGLVGFSPAIDVAVDSSVAGAPAGLSVTVRIPQEANAAARAVSHLKDVVMTFPEGMTLSPSVADGLAGCTDQQLGADGDPVACPEASKIGSVTMKSPALAEPAPGDIYVGTPTASERYRIFLVLHLPGSTVRLAGTVEPDPGTGRLTASFAENPQLPFSELTLRFKGGPRAPLVNPPSCGPKTVSASLSPWSDPSSPVPVSDSFSIEQGCGPLGFAPGFLAGSVNPAAGAFSPFAARFTRDNGDATLGRMNVTLPEGLLAKLAAVDVCPNAVVAQASFRSGVAAQGQAACPASSQIGSATVGAGAGAPFYPRLPGSDASGRVFLTEAYAPASGPAGQAPSYGLAIEVPAVAGPYDLGNVVVRAGVYVNPTTAQLRVVSDSLPTILDWIPLQIRDVRVNVDRSQFTVNPTSCDEKQVLSEIVSADGRAVSRSSRFQVGGCQGKAFTPKLALRLTGRKQRRPGRHPGLRAVLTQTDGGANVSRVRVVLPKSLALDPSNANGLCGYEQGLAADCPESSRIGTAIARTPLLKRPLTGPVYFVQGVRFDRRTGARIRTLPTLLTKLRGEVPIDLRATSTVRGGRLVSTFSTVPDAPVSRFDLRLRGGKGGILAVTGERNLCAQTNVASVQTDGHNGKQADFRTAVKTPCAKRSERGARR